MGATDTLAADSPQLTRSSREPDTVERLTAADLTMLWEDDFGWPQDIGVIAVLDGTPLYDAAGRLRIEMVRDAIARRLHLVPRLRQVLYRPMWGLGRPLWVDVQTFDIARHVRVQPLPAGSGEEQLVRACERLHARRLDQSRPLWELWLLPGLLAGRVGMFMKIHHAIADGVAGTALIGALLGPEPERDGPPPPWTPRPVPTRRKLLVDNVVRHGTALSTSLVHLAHPMRTWRRLSLGWREFREVFGDPAPRTSLNRPIGSVRRFGVCRSRLDLAKDVAHAASATVNDLVLAAIAGGLRELLQSRGEPVDSLVLRAMVPVSLRHGPSAPQGNLDGGMVVPVPVGEPETGRRLRLIAAATARCKTRVMRPPETGFLASAIVRKGMLRMMRRQRLANVYVTNVPGPRVPLHLGGARLLEMFPVVPLSGNLTLGVGVLSYAGQLNFTVITDQDGSDDQKVFLAGLQRALDSVAGHAIRHKGPGIDSEWL
jgi:WS/DGAT/MGAT family acyltransferase